MASPGDPRRGERRLGVDRRWSREPRDPDRRFGPVDRRGFERRTDDQPVAGWKRLLRRLFWPNRPTD